MPALNTQFVAPVGYGSLRSDSVYHFLHRVDAPDRQRVVLAHFTEKPARAHLLYISGQDFDKGLHEQRIKTLSVADSKRMPPWLSDVEQKSFDNDVKANIGDPKAPRRRTKWDVVEERKQIISPAVDEYQELFSLRDPVRAINAWIARASADGPSLNIPRVRLWLITYLAFGKNRWVLLPATKGRGTYSRDEPSAAKRGRPSRHGHGAGFNVTPEMKRLMQEGFIRLKRKLLGRSLAWAYVEILEKTFGCKVELRGKTRRSHIVHPEGHPFPTYGQFRYWIHKLLGHHTVWSALIGEQQYRNQYATTEGSYAEGLQDLLEKVYADTTQFADRPRSVLSNVTLPALKITEVVDGLSGMIVGVAFGFGEKERLYRQARAACALPKSLLGEVFGLSIHDHDWPVQCLALTEQTDQGAGAAKGARKGGPALGSTVDMTPAYTPQSNAQVESVHDRGGKKSGAPTFTVSKLTAFEMARQYLRDVIAKNKGKGVTRRLLPDQVAADVQSPNELWMHLEARGRINGIRMKVEDVIQTFLPEVTFVIKGERLTRHGLVYSSDAFKATKFFRELRKHEGAVLKGYAFDISSRVEWVIVDNTLLKVSSVPPMRTHDSSFVMNNLELESFGASKRSNASGVSYARHAERLARNLDVKQQTGKGYMPSETRRGRPKSGSTAARREVAASSN